MKVGKGRNANRALILTALMHNPRRVDKYSEVLPAFERWESDVKEFERDTNSRRAEVTKMNSLRQLVPKELEVDMTRLTHLDTWAEIKKYVLHHMVIRREPYFDQGLSNKKSKEPTYVPINIENISSETRDAIDDTSTSNEEETSHELAMMKGSGKGDHFPGYCNYCWKYGQDIRGTEVRANGHGEHQLRNA